MSDQTIDTQVVEQLAWDSRVDASDVGVTVKAGSVWLKGTVPSYQSKNAATWDANLVSGVKNVVNHLKVKYPSEVLDREIKKNVEEAIDWDFYIDNEDIRVSVHEGIVKLTGIVGHFWKKIQAEEDAFNINGVVDVVNELGIVLTDKWSDEFIAKHIERALDRNSTVDANDVNVTVKDGDVTLSGTVPRWSSRYAADNCAWYTLGVKSLVNDIIIA